MADHGSRGTAQKCRVLVQGSLARPISPPIQGNCPDSPIQAHHVGIPHGTPRVAVETEGVVLATPECFTRQAAAQEKGIREASSDVLPLVFMREKSRLGGNMEYDGDTELTSLSTDSTLQ